MLFSPHTQSASVKARAILEHTMCSKNIKAILHGIKHDPAGASCSLSYAPTPDDNSNNTGKSNPKLDFEFLGVARAGSLRNASKSPMCYGSSQMYQHCWKSCKWQRLKWGLYPAKWRVVPRPQLFRCLARTNHLARASPWLPRAVPEDTGMGKRQPRWKSCWRLTSFQRKKATLKREIGISSILFLGGRVKLSVPPAVSKALGHCSQARVRTVGPQVPAGAGTCCTSSLGGAEGKEEGAGRQEGEGNCAVPFSYAKKWKETINPLFSEYKKVVKIGLQGLCKWLC